MMKMEEKRADPSNALEVKNKEIKLDP